METRVVDYKDHEVKIACNLSDVIDEIQRVVNTAPALAAENARLREALTELTTVAEKSLSALWTDNESRGYGTKDEGQAAMLLQTSITAARAALAREGGEIDSPGNSECGNCGTRFDKSYSSWPNCPACGGGE